MPPMGPIPQDYGNLMNIVKCYNENFQGLQNYTDEYGNLSLLSVTK